MKIKTIHAQCVIAGGGPAGVMLGYLLARSGIDVIVLEKHKDFFRDFRGDTIHPSTLRLLDQLGLLEKFLELPHDKTERIGVNIEDKELDVVDFRYLKRTPAYVAFIPQWDFLNFISQEAKKYTNFDLMMDTKATDVIQQSGTIHGLKATNSSGSKTYEIFADLVIGADGRNSTIRDNLHRCRSSTMGHL